MITPREHQRRLKGNRLFVPDYMAFSKPKPVVQYGGYEYVIEDGKVMQVPASTYWLQPTQDV